MWVFLHETNIIVTQEDYLTMSEQLDQSITTQLLSAFRLHYNHFDHAIHEAIQGNSDSSKQSRKVQETRDRR